MQPYHEQIILSPEENAEIERQREVLCTKIGEKLKMEEQMSPKHPDASSNLVSPAISMNGVCVQ